MFNTADKLQFSDSLVLLVHHLAKIINYHLEANENITKSNLQFLQSGRHKRHNESEGTSFK